MNIGAHIRLIPTLMGWVLWELPVKLVRGSRPYVLREDVVWFDRDTKRTQIAREGMRHDRATLAPNLRKRDGSHSDAFPIHDTGWETGTWMGGFVLTFNQNNGLLYDILRAEKHPVWLCDLYYEWVSKDFMRKRWTQKFGEDAQRLHEELERMKARVSATEPSENVVRRMFCGVT